MLKTWSSNSWPIRLAILADKGKPYLVLEKKSSPDIEGWSSLSNKACHLLSHMTNIMIFLAKVNQHSLLLLDDWGLVNLKRGAAPLLWLFWRIFVCISESPWRRPTIRTQGLWVTGQPLRRGITSMSCVVCVRPIALCRSSWIQKQCLWNRQTSGLVRCHCRRCQSAGQPRLMSTKVIIEQLEEQTQKVANAWTISVRWSKENLKDGEHSKNSTTNSVVKKKLSLTRRVNKLLRLWNSAKWGVTKSWKTS